MTTLIIATRNSHKVEEIRAFLSPAYQYLTLRDFPNAPNVHEDAASFAGNAGKKALELAQWLRRQSTSAVAKDSRCFVLADDSGLEVDALQGAPGVHSARFAALDSGSAGNASDATNNEKLLCLLQTVATPLRTARFRCCIALTPIIGGNQTSASPVCDADEAELRSELFEGTCEGRIDHQPRGSHGFGYDPLFVPNGFRESFAELGQDIKNQISHRAKALEKLRHWLQQHSKTQNQEHE